MNNNELKQIFFKFKNILSGCRTIYDSLYFAQDIINKHPESKFLINGMIHGKIYDKILDFRTVAQTLNILNEFESRNDINEYINNNLKDNFDYIQIDAFMRTLKYKKNISNIDNDNDNKTYKFQNNNFVNSNNFITDAGNTHDLIASNNNVNVDNDDVDVVDVDVDNDDNLDDDNHNFDDDNNNLDNDIKPS
jgi:hypothetical protein